MGKRQRAKGAQPIIGGQAVQEPGTRSVYVGFRTLEPMPQAFPGGVQFNLSFNGPDAVPLFPGGTYDLSANSQTIYIGGQYDGFDPLLVGGTDTEGLEPGTRPDFNNTDALVNGYYRNGIWILEAPLPQGATTARVGLQAIVDGTQMVDWLTTPGGVNDLPLGGTALADDVCISGLSVPELDAAGAAQNYQLEFAIDSLEQMTPEDFAGLALVAAVDGDSQGVPGGWQVTPDGHAAYGNYIAPEGDVHVQADDWFSGSRSDGVDLNQLLGQATINSHGTQAGLFFGTRVCGLRAPADGGIPEDLLADLARGLGIDPTAGETFNVPAPDGSQPGVVVDETGQLTFVVAAGDRPATLVDFDRRAGSSFCDQELVELGARGIRETCPDGTQRLFWFTPFEGPPEADGWGRIFALEFPPSGFPNGRRSIDDMTEINLSDLLDPPSEPILDGIDQLERAYVGTFPFLPSEGGSN